MWLRRPTRALMALLGQHLALDVRSAEAVDDQDERRLAFLAAARDMLTRLDELDVGPDEDLDRARQRYLRSPPSVWLDLAEAGTFADADTVAHVAHYCSGGHAGYSGSAFTVLLLTAIDVGCEEHRDLLAGAFLTYVGLYRAWTQTADGAQRLSALLECGPTTTRDGGRS